MSSEDDTLPILFSRNRQLNLRYTKATASSTLVQKKSSNQVFSWHTHTECDTSPSQHRCKTLYFKRQEI